ncbi:MAG: PKD domain-containing protein, partial [Bacteroidia bacterium]|nr:PKD domain-containing protein [Bacteroidia bacterium]
VSLNVKPTASFVISPTVSCPPFALNFTNTSTNAGTYVWNFGTSPTSTSNASNPSFTYSNTGQSILNYTVKLVSTTGAGCADSITKVLSVRPKPVASYTASTFTGCAPLVTTFSNTSIGASSSLWSFGDGGTSGSANPSHTYTNLTLFTQTVSTKLIVTNSVGCTDSTAQVITIYPEALPTFTVLPAIGCSPLNVNFPSVPGIATYTWTHGDSSPTFTTVNSHTWTYTNSGSTTLVYTINMVALTSNGCIGVNTQTVGVYANPVVDFAFTPTAVCSPATIIFTNTSVGNAANKWSFGNGQSSLIASPTATFGNLPGAGTTTYSIKLVASSSTNCKDSVTKTVSMYPQPKAVFGLDTPACSPKTISFTNNSINGFSYKWDFGDGVVATGSNTSHKYVNTSAFNTIYSVKLVANSANNCRDSMITQMAVHPKPNFFISSSPDSGCSPIKVVFHKLSGVTKYEWKYDNISFGNAGEITNSFENKGTNTKLYNIELIATDVFQCVDTANKIIKVFPIPEAKYSISPLTVYVPNQACIFTNLSTSALTYTWSFGDGTKSNEFNTSHTYSAPGEYSTSLIITNNKGCRDTFELPSKVLALNETTVIVPNAFTPNPSGSKGGIYDPKDLSNDVFYPQIKGTDRYTLSIYSRWGELLFETKNTEEGWDGYYKGVLCTQDVYVWKITATFSDGRTYNKSGDLLLLR